MAFPSRDAGEREAWLRQRDSGGTTSGQIGGVVDRSYWCNGVRL